VLALDRPGMLDDAIDVREFEAGNRLSPRPVDLVGTRGREEVLDAIRGSTPQLRRELRNAASPTGCADERSPE
jgi:hypothetical protein